MVLPGGYGTLDELFEAVTLVATGKITKFPIVLVGSTYWAGLLSWLKETLLGRGNIRAGELALPGRRRRRRGRENHQGSAHGPVRPLTPPGAGVLFHCQDMARFFMCLLYC